MTERFQTLLVPSLRRPGAQSHDCRSGQRTGIGDLGGGGESLGPPSHDALFLGSQNPASRALVTFTLTSWRAVTHPPRPHHAQPSFDSLLSSWDLEKERGGGGHGWGPPYDSHPRGLLVSPGLPRPSERGCAGGRFANGEAAALPCSFFTTLSRLSRLKQLQMNHHKAITRRAAVPCAPPCPARGPRSAAWAASCRHLRACGPPRVAGSASAPHSLRGQPP